MFAVMSMMAYKGKVMFNLESTQVKMNKFIKASNEESPVIPLANYSTNFAFAMQDTFGTKFLNDEKYGSFKLTHIT
jgi:hypothetical protein